MKMTNEEAVKIIESVEPDGSVYGWRKVADAFNLAIKALENQPKWQQALNNACCDIDGLVSEMNCEPHWIQRRSVSDYMEDTGIEVADNEQM